MVLRRFPKDGEWIVRRKDTFIKIICENKEKSENRKLYRVYYANTYSKIRKYQKKYTDELFVWIPNKLKFGDDSFISKDKIMLEML